MLVHWTLTDKKTEGVGLLALLWIVKIEVVGHVCDISFVTTVDLVASHVEVPTVEFRSVVLVLVPELLASDTGPGAENASL